MTTTSHVQHNAVFRKTAVDDLFAKLPGAELVAAGVAALQRGERTTEALLVALAAPRLRDIGLRIPEAADGIAWPNLAPYATVCAGGGGHFEYNALLGRMSSSADAAERSQRRTAWPTGYIPP